jgi:diguanylate cyclase (GGDEF)-like protein
MSKYSRESIIGLGESSFRKNYYPELQEKIIDLERLNLRNEALIRAIPDIILISDLEGNLMPFGSSLRREKKLLDQMLNTQRILSVLESCVKKISKEQKSVNCSFMLDVDQEERHFEVRAHATELEEILILIRDITTESVLKDRLRFMAERDPLTSSYNRWSFEERMDAYQNSEEQNFGLLVLDIDGLKVINDTLGHYHGDEVIKKVSHMIHKVLGDNAYIARIGGDEFGVMLKGVHKMELEEALASIYDEVSLMNQMDGAIQISVSVGYAFHENGPINGLSLYQEADNNMYQNKLLKTSSYRSNLVRSLMKALEARDYITEGHADRMDELAELIGRQMGLTSVELDRIALLCKFHDIGKVGIPDSILKKPGKLTDEEYKVMKTHAVIGERIANASGELKEISYLIMKHHERYDGKGYPTGLKGDEIPIECQVLSVVDAYDAMTNDRPYRKALSKEVAIEEIVNHRGSQFSPQVVDAFLQVMMR